jgi:hypothetical protein
MIAPFLVDLTPQVKPMELFKTCHLKTLLYVRELAKVLIRGSERGHNLNFYVEGRQQSFYCRPLPH